MDKRKVTELAASLAAELTRMVPNDVTLDAAEGELIVHVKSATEYLPLGTRIDLALECGSSDVDAVVVAVEKTLHELQDLISESETVPWPQDETATHVDLAFPHVQPRSNQLFFWFGQEKKTRYKGRLPLP